MQGFTPGGTRAEGHHVPQVAVGLGVEFVEDNYRRIQAMLGKCLSAQHPDEGAGASVVDLFAAVYHPDHLLQRRVLLDHLLRGLVGQAGLEALGGAAVNFAARWIAEQVVKGEPGDHLGFPVLLGNFKVGLPVLPAAILLHGAVNVPDNLVLPVEQ